MDYWNLLPQFVRRPAMKAYMDLAMYAKYVIWYSTHWRNPDYHKIPIIINNFNRLTFLQQLIQSLEIRGYNNIFILDNDSTYPPLLDYYDQCPYTVFRLEKNLGFRALWISGLYEKFKKSFYVYTDSDIVVDEDCPEDFMAFFLNALKRHPKCMKVGFGLRIDDLPECFNKREEVVKHESKFWTKPIGNNLFLAQIDTTFALYRPFCYGHADGRHMMLRSGKPYVAKHNPWYNDSDHLTEEEIFYIESCSKETFWTERDKKDFHGKINV